MCNLIFAGNNDDGVPTKHLTPPPPGYTGILLLQLGTFSPPTVSHVRLLLAGYDTARARLKSKEIISGGFMSPVGDKFDKASARSIAWKHRVNMCHLALREVDWAEVTWWEASQEQYTRSHIVVSHILNVVSNSFPESAFDVHIVCGQDLRRGMKDRLKWPRESVLCLQRKVKGFLVKRRDTGDGQLKDDDDNENDVWIDEWVGNLSSTVIREYIEDGRSIHMMTPQAVEKYIYTYRLYLKQASSSKVELS